MLFNSSSRPANQDNPFANRTRLFNFSSDYGDSLKNAENIGSIKRGKSYDYSGDVGGDDLDFFKFKLDRRGKIFATLNNKSDRDEPIAISLLNRQGKVVKAQDNFLFANVEAGESQTISVRGLAKGTYFLRIQSENGRDEDYDLNLSQSGSSSPTPGFDQSVNLGTLRPGDLFSESGTVGGSDVDFYRFSVDNTSRISARLSSSDFNADPIAFSILDSQRRTVMTESGRFLFSNVEGGDSDTLFAPTLASGTYYVRVQSEQGRNEPYQLLVERSTVTVTPI
ncbi:pre-peptidase C-terminal domain-containing protein [Leptolyngbya sp. FACHB-711]|uniref:pre-peptidase C-terminal domain-containing protein n=1 Tax=Leptolyngbya sp. FACHB-711 TaxID=2692813 RepID=UPI001689F582|nr:pre-peptidase C-terminal domain-containing protein [Leptolyngbya sp. FACHB-711]MBD1852146.1 T9SS type A sorting domain-containing protein [Cyanobacteria bacterium FACHB-502]MBD2027048.1 T9SS type A sorting domain-containing protein [Leptolyngbya sp. FACHB-711]